MSSSATIISNATVNYLASDAANPFLETPNKIGRLYVLASGQLSFQEKKYAQITNWDDTYKYEIWKNPQPATAVALTAPFRLTMETNGNLTFKNSASVVIWQSNTGGQGVSPYTLELRNSGEIVVKDNRSTILWSSQTFFSFYLVDDARLVGYFNPGVMKSFDYTNTAATNKIMRNLKKLLSNASKGTINGSFTINGNFVIRLNNSSAEGGNISSALSIKTAAPFRTISFWLYVYDIATATSPTCLLDIPDVGSITSNAGVSAGLQSGGCMIDGGAQEALMLAWTNFEKKGKWTNITVSLSQPANVEFTLFNNQLFNSGMNCAFGPVLVYNDTITPTENFANYYFFRKYFYPLSIPIPLPFELDRVKYVHADSAYDIPPPSSTPRTPEDCRQLALADQNKYSGWLYINETHPTAELRNSCKLLLKTAVNTPVTSWLGTFIEKKPFTNAPEVQSNMYTTGCSNIGQRPEWACAALPDGIDHATGFSDITSSAEVIDLFKQTPSDCRAKASLDSKYKAWAYATINHPDSGKRNTCILYTDELQPITPNYKIDSYITGCINKGEVVSLGCQVPPPPPPEDISQDEGGDNSTTTNPNQNESSTEEETLQSSISSSTINRRYDKSSKSTTVIESNGYDWKKILKWVGIGLGSFLGFVFLIVVLVMVSRKKSTKINQLQFIN